MDLPNTNLWYATSDKTGMHVRLQMHWDLRPDATNKFPVTGKDTVATRCKAAGVSGQANVTVVNNTCMNDPGPFNFAGMYTFLVRHEQCHLKQFMDVFPTIADPRTRLETIVRADTSAFHQAAAPLYDAANRTILDANNIDVASGQTYTFWSRNPMNTTTAANVTWILRP